MNIQSRFTVIYIYIYIYTYISYKYIYIYIYIFMLSRCFCNHIIFVKPNVPKVLWNMFLVDYVGVSELSTKFISEEIWYTEV